MDEFIAANADPIWLNQHGMWELMPDFGSARPGTSEPPDLDDYRQIPF